MDTTQAATTAPRKPCTRCAGKGIIDAYIEVRYGGTCVRCHGTGIDPGRKMDKTITVNGTEIRLAGNNARQVVEAGTDVRYFTDMAEAKAFANAAYRAAR